MNCRAREVIQLASRSAEVSACGDAHRSRPDPASASATVNRTPAPKIPLASSPLARAIEQCQGNQQQAVGGNQGQRVEQIPARTDAMFRCSGSCCPVSRSHRYRPDYGRRELHDRSFLAVSREAASFRGTALISLCGAITRTATATQDERDAEPGHDRREGCGLHGHRRFRFGAHSFVDGGQAVSVLGGVGECNPCLGRPRARWLGSGCDCGCITPCSRASRRPGSR